MTIYRIDVHHSPLNFHFVLKTGDILFLVLLGDGCSIPFWNRGDFVGIRRLIGTFSGVRVVDESYISALAIHIRLLNCITGQHVVSSTSLVSFRVVVSIPNRLIWVYVKTELGGPQFVLLILLSAPAERRSLLLGRHRLSFHFHRPLCAYCTRDYHYIHAGDHPAGRD